MAQVCKEMRFIHRETNEVIVFHKNRNALTALARQSTLTLSNYCTKHNLDRQAMYKVYRGERQHHKGWVKAS